MMPICRWLITLAMAPSSPLPPAQPHRPGKRFESTVLPHWYTVSRKILISRFHFKGASIATSKHQSHQQSAQTAKNRSLLRNNDLLAQSTTETLLDLLKSHAGIKECSDETILHINGVCVFHFCSSLHFFSFLFFLLLLIFPLFILFAFPFAIRFSDIVQCSFPLTFSQFSRICERICACLFVCSFVGKFPFDGKQTARYVIEIQNEMAKRSAGGRWWWHCRWRWGLQFWIRIEMWALKHSQECLFMGQW